MENISTLIDNLCDKLEPYVRSAVDEIFPKEEPVEYEVDTEALDALITEEEPDEEVRKLLVDELSYVFAPPDPDSLYKVRVDVNTELIASTWSEALRWTYKEQGETKLRDCLLPDNLGRAERAWRGNINHTGFSQEQVEDLLRKFGQGEILDRLELPWGGYVKRVGEDYILKKEE